MMTTCDQVAERIALGEPLADLAAHSTTCEHCKVLLELPTRLGATRTPIDPGLGFSARMTAGAQHRITVRRRQRVMLSVTGSVAATLALVFVVTRAADGRSPVTTAMTAMPDPVTAVLEQVMQPPPTPPIEPTHDATHRTAAADDTVAALVRMADTRSAMRFAARWSKIERPVAPYRHLVISLKGQEGPHQ